MEVVMVRLACHLIAGRLPGQRDGVEPAIRQQRLDIAIYGRDPQGRVAMLGCGKSFFRRERPIRFDEGIANGLFLTGVARNGLWHVG